MKFAYTALTKDNKKITGVLDVENKDAAQTELHKMGIAIISVNEISDEEYQRLGKEEEVIRAEKGIQTFTFLAVDSNKKEVEGTIDAVDDYSAYKRLRTEYQFTVNNLFLSSASDIEKEQAASKLANFAAQFEAEMAQMKVEKKEEKGLEGDEDEAMNQELITEIDRVIINTKKVLETHGDLFSNELIQEVNNTLGTLERIRTSNNIKHITEVSNELYELVSNPDKIEGEVKDENYQALKNEIGNSALVKKEFELYRKAIEATGLKRVFRNIAKRLRDMTAPAEETGKPPGFFAKIKLKFNTFFKKLTKKKLPKVEIKKKALKPKTGLALFFEKLGAYFKAGSPVLKRTRKKELGKAFRSMFSKKKEAATPETPEGNKAEELKKAVVKTKAKRKPGATGLLVEIDSFIGWLLCFYIIYFFLVSFALEKNIGLDRDFVFKTLKTPLILNITIFLLLLHFMLRLRNLHFRHNFLATLFLFFLTLGTYALLIVNF